MTPETLTVQIRAGDSQAVATAAKLGPAAAPTLQVLVKDKDPEVRLWSLRCFDAVGGEAAETAGIDALVDKDQQVAAQGVMLLHHHPPKGRGPELRAAFHVADSSFVRAEIPKVAGRISTESETKIWVVLLPSVTDEEVRKGVMIGLARMGDERSREWFAGKLAAADGPNALPWLEAAEYMEDRWIVPTLSKLLSRTTPVYTVAADFKPEQVRVCDLAAYVVLKITAAKVDFPVRKGRYKDVEIDAARAAAAGKK